MFLSSEDPPLHGVARLNGVQLFQASQLLVQQRSVSLDDELFAKGAQRFYFTRLALLRRQPSLRIELDEVKLPVAATSLFLQTLPTVAERLSLDFKRGLSILAAPTPLLRWREVGAWLMIAPEFHQTLEHLTGSAWHTKAAWPRGWERFWQETEQEYAARMSVYLRPARLRVTVVAHAGASAEEALAMLRRRLAQDRALGLSVPHPEAYLYDEPLIDWVTRPLLAGEWIARLVQMLEQAQGDC
jgi:hypothetical protein